MNKKAALLLFVAAGIILQFGVIVSMLARHELTLRRGETFLFRTAPVDPFDAFRGRYVALDFDAFRNIQCNSDLRLRRGQRVCLLLGTNANGFATIIGATNRPPDAPYLTATFLYNSHYDSAKGTSRIRIAEPPFSRFYLPEHLAPEAEAAYNDATRRRTVTNAAAVVRVRNGTAVVEDLVFDGQPLREHLKQRAAAKEPNP